MQITREADKFRYYAHDGQVPPDPRSEMDEHYSKDEKVPQIDLEVFANAHIQKQEEKQFQQDMLKLQAEVDFLEEGKCQTFGLSSGVALLYCKTGDALA